MHNKRILWNGGLQAEAMDILEQGNGMVVSPTKVGYIIVATDRAGLERKFAAKNRKKSKPSVVLCGSLEQLSELAELNDEILDFYQDCWNNDVLMGCILPWKDDSLAYIPDDGSLDLVTDPRRTSCFVVKFGTPGENIAAALWERNRQLLFASSANPSGVGNRGIVEGIGEVISDEADLIIEANDYVSSIQPGKSEHERHEQGIMVSMVDDSGALIPEQAGKRDVTPVPTLIRKGIYLDEVLPLMAKHFQSWDYRHGQYY